MKSKNHYSKTALYAAAACIMLVSLFSLTTLSSCSGCNGPADTTNACNCKDCKNCNYCHKDTFNHDGGPVTSGPGGFSLCEKDTTPKGNDSLAGARVSLADYQALVTNFNPSGTGGAKGGSIGKWQMMALLRSLGEEEQYIHFRYIKDPLTGRTGVVFIGGNGMSGDAHVASPVRLMYRNMGFCPDWCPDLGM